MTALARPLSDSDRSLARQVHVRSMPAAIRVGIGLLAAAALLWPLVPLFAEAVTTTDLWSRALISSTWLTLWQAALAATLGVGLSVPLGWALARLGLPARRFIRALLTVPIVTPALGIALGASWLLGPGWPLLVIANIGLGLAVGVRLGGSAWLALDPHEVDTASSLGLSFPQIVRWHLIPTLGPAYLAAWALSLALAVGAFGAAYLLAPSSVLALPEAAGAFSEAQPAAAPAAIVLTIVVTASLVTFLRCRPTDHLALGPVGYRPLGEIAVRGRLLLAAAFALAGVVALGPLFALLHGAVTIGAAEQVTGANIAAFFEDARPLEVDTIGALQRSLVLGLAALLLALPLGLVVSVLVAPLRGWSATVVEAALLLPLLLPVVLAAGLREAGLDGASWLLFVHLGIALAIVVRVVLPMVRARMRAQFEAATLLGASRWESWRRLVGAGMRARIAVAGVLALAWSVGDLGAALLLQRADTAPASVAIAYALDRQSAREDGRAFAIAAVLVLFVSILFVTIEYRRSREIAEF